MDTLAPVLLMCYLMPVDLKCAHKSSQQTPVCHTDLMMMIANTA
jgi:hypothetical protein